MAADNPQVVVLPQAGAGVAPEVPGYETLQPIAAGGMAQVFLARQRNLERLVAIKFLAPQTGAADREHRLRFEREARLMAQVAHPNIVAVFDRGTAGGRDYLVLEYVEGVSVRGLLEVSAPLAVPQARRILREVAQALAYLHDRGIVHRDVKPGNVLISANGAVRVTDFGIAFLAGEEGAITQTGHAVGTLDYMAPEQRSRLPVDARADQFSLAVMAYELLTAKRPLGSGIKPPSQLNPALDRRVDPVLLQALRQDPEDRYPSVQAFAEALDGALGQPPPRRKPALATALLVAGLVAGLGSGLTLRRVFDSGRADAPGPTPEPSGAHAPPPKPPIGRPTTPKKKAPPDRKRLAEIADEHAKRGRWREALAALDEAGHLSPNDPSLHARRGEAYLRLEKYPSAIAAFGKAVGLNPKDPAYRSRRGWSYYMNHQNEEAVKELTRAVALDPKDAESHRNLACAYFQLRQYEQALRALQRAMELMPERGFFWYLRGQVYEATGKDELALADYLHAAGRSTTHPVEPHRALATLLAKSSNQAVRDKKKALEHAWKAYDASNGADWQAVEALAFVYNARQESREAIRWCKKALELAPVGSRADLQKLLDEYTKRAPPVERTDP